MKKHMGKFILFSISLFFMSPLWAQEYYPKDNLESAFAQDGLEVIRTVSFQGMRGMMSMHLTAKNYETQERKRVYYVEGTGYQMGYLIGLLAPDQVERMSTEYVDKVVFDFIGINIDPDKIQWLWNILKGIILQGSLQILDDIPTVYKDELQGLVDGCKAANPQTKVTFNNLLILNAGIDCMLSVIYNLTGTRECEIDPADLRLPMCNAFSVFGKATVGGKHYLGRDFMFSTAGVFQDLACMIIYRPTDGRIPVISVAAPGFIGSIAAMNMEKLASGVDMSPAGCCNSKRPGINSLLMVRYAMQGGKDAQSALQLIVNAQRGVSWNYIIGDGKNNSAVAVEAGCKVDEFLPFKYPPQELKDLNLLPTQTYLNQHDQGHQKGLMVRWHNYVYPVEFLDFNRGLFNYYGKAYDPNVWGEKGYINPTHNDKNCPKAYYFAPQRENKDDVLVMINHFVVPTMRLTGMNPATVLIAAGNLDDIQWRYDELNYQILEAYGSIDYQKAKELIDFLAPSYKFPDYYKDNATSSDGKTKRINGTVSLCNLTDLTIDSHYGYYADSWVKITLGNYFTKK